MEEGNEDDLIMYEESKEITETIWEVWDLLNDKEIITKILLKSSLLNELDKIKSLTLLNPKETKNDNNADEILSIKDQDKAEKKNGN
jgi:hypothetical protein